MNEPPPTTRRLLSCDRCDASAWIGPTVDHLDAWCEGCQRPASIPAGLDRLRCPHCGQPLTLGEPRFEELFGDLQSLVAVLEAWSGDAARLKPLVPERPRFLSDLAPPETSSSDDPRLVAALAALRAGAFADARAGLERWLSQDRSSGSPPDARAWLALAIASQRLGDLAGAEAAFGRALDVEPGGEVARLDRAALRARRGDLDGARADLERAGSRIEARWNRAALLLLEGVALGSGMPDASRLSAARDEAGAPSSYWSDHTVGRLLFALLVERARTRGADGCRDARVLRAAERELEFDTFDDRALTLLGYATLGLGEEVERVAAPLASRLLQSIAAEPFVRGAAGRFLAQALEEAGREVADRRPIVARAHLAPLLGRDDLRRYRIPCARCGRGSIGVEQVEDEAGASSG